MDPQQQHLFSLMAMMKEIYQGMDAAIEGIARERAALAQERAALACERAVVAQVAGQLTGISEDVRKAATDAVVLQGH